MGFIYTVKDICTHVYIYIMYRFMLYTWNPTPPYFHVLNVSLDLTSWPILGAKRSSKPQSFFGVLYLYMRRSWTSQLPPLPKLILCQQPPPGWLTMFPWKNLGTWYSWWFINLANHVDMQNPSKCLQSTCIYFNYLANACECRISEEQQHQGFNKKP